MNYLVKFTVDNGCREDKHNAIINAKSTGEAIFKFNQYIDSKLKYDETIPQSTFIALKDEDDILYCDYVS